jgi:hypothetical protein
VIDFTALRADRERLVAVLTAAGAQIRSGARTFKCPYHEDTSDSGSIFQGKDGGWRFKCFAVGCGAKGDVLDLMARAEGIDYKEAMKRFGAQLPQKLDGNRPSAPARAPAQTAEPAAPSAPEKTLTIYASRQEVQDVLVRRMEDKGELEQVYVYLAPDVDRDDLVVFRFATPTGKTFKQAHERPEGGFVLSGAPRPLPLYRRREIAPSEWVVVTEGEKACEALVSIGVPATTKPGGGTDAAGTDWAPLAGKAVYLWPDNDPLNAKGVSPGREYMREVARVLAALRPAPVVYWIEPTGLDLPPKGDAYEWVGMQPDFMSVEEKSQALRDQVLARAQLLGPVGELELRIQAIISGQFVATPWPWEPLTELTQALLPGTMTILCGSPGSTKSLMLLQCLGFWFDRGVAASCLELEDSIAHHLQRVMAQRTRTSGYTQLRWVAARGQSALEMLAEQRAWLVRFAPCLHKFGEDQDYTVENLLRWVEVRARAKDRVIVIDPYSLASFSAKVWMDDKQFVLGAQRIVEREGCSLILVTHPRGDTQGRKLAALTESDMAGSQVLPRSIQNILWLHYHGEPVTNSVDVGPMLGTRSVTHNRTMKIEKARNAAGTKRMVAFEFQQSSLTLDCLGAIVGKPNMGG